jgi:CheY-like chemotaxis protein
MNLLFVEDNQTIQKVVSNYLDSWEYNYDIASNGKEAVDFAIKNEGKYDICFMDTSMPIMNGFSATKAIRQKVKYFPILSTSLDFEFEDKLLEIGADDFIPKPYEPDTLFEKINELTIKSLSFILQDTAIVIKKETPMNKEELLELKELKKQGLTKLKLIGTDHVFVVHKNIQNKISHDLIGNGKELSVFIDRSEDEPGKCHLYKANLHVTKDIFIPEELADAIKEEDQIAIKFAEPVDTKSID